LEARMDHLKRFYGLLEDLERGIDDAPRTLKRCHGRMGWPKRGVYFFREPGEDRSDTGSGPRIVRVGTHALNTGARTKLWSRLAQHRGSARSGGGNHRGSIFRLLVGTALIERDGHKVSTWGKGKDARRDIREGEACLERTVSRTIGKMPFLWLAVDDESGPKSCRGYIERNAIALLSNYGCGKSPLDRPSDRWLGHSCGRKPAKESGPSNQSPAGDGRFRPNARVRKSGLWNQKHVDEPYDPAFLDRLERLIDAMVGAA